MFFKNNIINYILKCELKIYKTIKSSNPFLSKLVEKNIKWLAKLNFENTLNKTKTDFLFREFYTN